MRISGYGEFQQMRKLSQKDDAQNKENAERSELNEDAGETTDAVLISPEARRKARLRQASDFRDAKVADVKARLAAGSLVTPDSLRKSTRKMIDGLLNGDL